VVGGSGADAACGGLGLNFVGSARPLLGRPMRANHFNCGTALKNLSGDPAQEYFADGMTEALITELARSAPCK